MSPDLLAQLRDIHLPPPPSFWPPAPGWWLLAAVVVALAVLAWRRLPGWLARRRLRRAILGELAALRRRADSGEASASVAADVSVLLRRAALARAPRGAVAGLSGERWLAWLDAGLGAKARDFREGPGRHLASAPYGGPAPADAAALLDLAERWVRRDGQARREG